MSCKPNTPGVPLLHSPPCSQGPHSSGGSSVRTSSARTVAHRGHWATNHHAGISRLVPSTGMALVYCRLIFPFPRWFHAAATRRGV